MVTKNDEVDGAQPDSETSDDAIERIRADAVIIQHSGADGDGRYTVQAAAGGPNGHRTPVVGERVYLNGGRTFPFRSEVHNDVSRVVVTRGPKGDRCVDVQLNDEEESQ